MSRLIAWTLLLALVACHKPTVLKLKGSDTVLPIAQEFAEHFFKSDSGVDISVTAGGSGVGIKALIEDNADVAMSSRELTLNEVLTLSQKPQGYQQLAIAYDALAVVVHPDNPVKQLKREQIEAIFTGKVRNWKDVGGPDRNIVLYTREAASGTYEFFKSAVLQKKEYADFALKAHSNGALIEHVKQEPGAVAYVGVSYIEEGIKALAVSFDGGSTYIEPNDHNAMKGTYPIVRPLYFIYLNQNRQKLEPLIQFCGTEKARLLIKKAGGIPVSQSATASTR